MDLIPANIELPIGHVFLRMYAPGAFRTAIEEYGLFSGCYPNQRALQWVDESPSWIFTFQLLDRDDFRWTGSGIVDALGTVELRAVQIDSDSDISERLKHFPGRDVKAAVSVALMKEQPKMLPADTFTKPAEPPRVGGRQSRPDSHFLLIAQLYVALRATGVGYGIRGRMANIAGIPRGSSAIGKWLRQAAERGYLAAPGDTGAVYYLQGPRYVEHEGDIEQIESELRSS